MATVPAPEEPQNELTKAFSQQELQDVKILRSKLPEIAEELYSDKAKVISLWGVELSPTAPTAKSSVVLVKFVRARCDFGLRVVPLRLLMAFQ